MEEENAWNILKAISTFFMPCHNWRRIINSQKDYTKLILLILLWDLYKDICCMEEIWGLKLCVRSENFFDIKQNSWDNRGSSLRVRSEFDLPSRSGSTSTSNSGVSIASANTELLSLGSPSSWLCSSCFPSFWSLAAWMTTSGIWFGSLGSANSLFVV